MNQIGMTDFNLLVQAVGYYSENQLVQLQDQTASYHIQLQRATQSFDITALTVEHEHADTSQTGNVFEAFDEVGLEAKLANNSDEIQNIRLYLMILDENNQIVDHFSDSSLLFGWNNAKTWEKIAAHSEIEKEMEWYVNETPLGLYHLVIQAFDGPTDQLLAERSVDVEILPTRQIGGIVEFDPMITQLDRNKPINITAKLINRGNQNIEATTVTAKIIVDHAGANNRKVAEANVFIENNGLSTPYGMDKDAEGNYYVVNQSNNTVSKVTSSGDISLFADGFSSPVDVDVAADGRIYVLNKNTGFVILTPQGERTQINIQGAYTSIEVLDSGEVLLASFYMLQSWKPDGTLKTLISGWMRKANGIVKNSQDEIFITDTSSNKIVQYKAGQLSTFVDNIKSPYGLSIDQEDNLYTVDYNGGILYKITPTAEIVEIANTSKNEFFDMAVGNNKNLFISNKRNNQILQYSADSQVQPYANPTINKPLAAVFDNNGDMVVLNGDNSIVRIPEQGLSEKIASNLYSLLDLWVNPDNSYAILQSNFLSILSPDGTINQLTKLNYGAHSMTGTPQDSGYYITMPNDNTILHVDPQGQVATHVEDHFVNPIAMQAASNGDQYILSAKGYITKVDSDAYFSRFFSDLKANSYHLMKLDAQDNLVVFDAGKKEIIRITPAQSVELIATLDFQPQAMAIMADNSILLAHGKTIKRLDEQGDITDFMTLSRTINKDMVVETNGTVWATTSGIIIKKTATIEQTFTMSAVGLTLDGNGGVYAATRGSIQHIKSQGEIIALFEGGALGQQDLVAIQIDAQNRYWIMLKSGQLNRFNPDKTLDKQYSTLFQPKGITNLNNDLYVTNTGNQLILKITHPDQLPEVIAFGNYERIFKENENSLLLSLNANVKRLDVKTHQIDNLISGYERIKAVAVAPSGKIVVLDNQANRYGYHDQNGQLLEIYYGLVQPSAVNYTQAGELLVANSFPKGILKVTAEGKTQLFGDKDNYRGISIINDIYQHDNGDLYVSAGTSVFHLSPEGLLKKNYVTNNAQAAIVDKDGRLLVLSENLKALVHYHEDGTSEIISSGVSDISDIEQDQAGKIYLSDRFSGRVMTYNENQSLSLSIDNIPGARRLVFDASNTLYVIYDNNYMATLTAAGEQGLFKAAGGMPGDINGAIIDQDGNMLTAVSTYNALYKLNLVKQTPPLNVGEVVYSRQLDIPALTLGGDFIDLTIGDWLPTQSGDFRIELSASNDVVKSQVVNKIHIGPNATTVYSLDKEVSPPGDIAVQGTLQVLGANTIAITQIDTDAIRRIGRVTTNGRAIAGDTRGNVYTIRKNGNGIVDIIKITPQGEDSVYVTGLPTMGAGISVDSKDNLYAFGWYNKTIYKITPDQTVHELVVFDKNVTALTVDYQDRLYAIGEFNQLLRIAEDGTTQLIAYVVNGKGLTVDYFGNFYIVDGESKIRRVSSNGAVTLYYDAAQFEFEGVNITADCAKNLFFAPVVIEPWKPKWKEEDLLFQIVGETGDVVLALNGPTYSNRLADLDVLQYDRFGNRLLMWADNNIGFYEFPVKCGGIDAELHLISKKEVDMTSADPSPTRTIALADGTTEYIWELTNVGPNGIKIKANWLFKAMREGEKRSAAAQAYLTFANSFKPDEAITVPVDIPKLLAASAITLTTSVNASQYQPNTEVVIQAQVNNETDTVLNGHLKLAIKDSHGVLVEALTDIPMTELAPQTINTYASQWNTQITYQGQYQFETMLLNDANETIKTTRVPFAIVTQNDQQNAQIETRITTDKPAYKTRDNAKIQVRISNQSINANQGPGIATLTIIAADNTILLTESRATNSLYANQLQDLEYHWRIQDNEPGDYTLKLVYANSATGDIITTQQTTVALTLTGVSGVIGNLTTDQKQVYAGQIIQCTGSIQNTGNSLFTKDNLKHLLISMADNTQVSEYALTDISPTSTETFSQAIATQDLTPGGYGCVLQANQNGQWQTLAAAAFQVKSAPIEQITGSVSLSSNQVEQGQSNTCLQQINNANPVAITNLQVQHQLKAQNGDLIQQDQTTIDIAANSDYSQTQSITSKTMAPGFYDCVLSVNHNDQLKTLASSRFEVIEPEPSVVLEPQINITNVAQGRLLILAEPNPFTLQWLEQILADYQWQYTIVVDPYSFFNAMRSGRYNMYALLPRHALLSHDHQRELREAVNRGENLLVIGGVRPLGMGTHHADAIDEALGVYRTFGWPDIYQEVQLSPSPIYQGDDTFTLYGQNIITQIDTAEIAGEYTTVSNKQYHKKGGDNTAITYQNYGDGKTVFFAFDLITPAAFGKHPTILPQLFLNALEYLTPDQPLLDSSDLIPFHFQLNNPGSVVSGFVTFNLTHQAVFIPDNRTRLSHQGQTLEWYFDLDENENLTLPLWIIAPEHKTTISAHVQIFEGNDLVAYQTLQTDIIQQVAPTLEKVTQTVEVLAANESRNACKPSFQFGIKPCYANMARELRKAMKMERKRIYEVEMMILIDQAEALIQMNNQEADDIRYQLDHVIKRVERYLIPFFF